MDVVDQHLETVKTSVLSRYTAEMVPDWICKHTFYGGLPYSYQDHEYQQKILGDTSREINVRKCSQVGISEASARMSLALCKIMRKYTIAYTLPTAKFAGTFAKTRIDPVVETSPTLKGAVHKTMDNNEVKQFGESFLYLRGAASSNAPISIPCDHLVHDEVDFSDPEVLTQYLSRLTHSKYRRITRISTPTLPDFGIDKEFKGSRRHFLMCKCSHCGCQFVPSYYNHVKIPGYLGDLRELTKFLLPKVRWKEAALHCPSCGQVPDLSPKYREWVVENCDEAHDGAGYQVTPFDAPKIIQVPYLVETSTKYARRQDFDNFNLGIPAEDREATLTPEDFKDLFVVPHVPAGWPIMGVDVGNTYHFVVGIADGAGVIHVVHMERVPMGIAKKRYWDLKTKYRVLCTVMDSNPHSETVMSLQEADPSLFAAVYVKQRGLLTHTVQNREHDADKGQKFVRQVSINRSRALDSYMVWLRSGGISFSEATSQEDQETKQAFIAQHCSMKRVRQFDTESGEMIFQWVKTDGDDHFHHTMLYLHTAAQIHGLTTQLQGLNLFGLGTMRLKSK